MTAASMDYKDVLQSYHMEMPVPFTFPCNAPTLASIAASNLIIPPKTIRTSASVMCVCSEVKGVGLALPVESEALIVDGRHRRAIATAPDH